MDPDTTSRNPLVSIACITYNHEAFIGRALDSFLMQQADFPFEVVVGEDGGRDQTRAICESYQRKHPQTIRLLPSGSNQGVFRNLMKTIQACQGKYIALCEGDDYWSDPLKLQKQYRGLEGDPSCVVSFHDTSLIDTHDQLIPGSKLKDKHRKNFSRDELLQGVYLPTPTLMFRNVPLNIPGYFMRSINADSLLIAALSRFGGAMYQEDVGDACSRIHANGVWSAKDKWYRQLHTLRTRIIMFRYLNRTERETAYEYYYQKFKEVIHYAACEGNREYWYKYHHQMIALLWWNKKYKLIVYYLRKILSHRLRIKRIEDI